MQQFKMKRYTEYIEEKSLEFNVQEITKQRCEDHIERVKYFYNKLVEGGMIPENEINTEEVMKHDADKLEPENIRRQSLRMTATGVPKPEDEKDIYEVIRDHVKSNPHHCEFWGKPNEDHMSVGVHCESMPDKYIYEMMADWASTAEERGTIIKDWYDKCVLKENRWFFNDHQKEIMLACMDYLQDFVEAERKREYGFKYIDPAQIWKK